jgi:sugar-specific transcriptional regulator TrmB
MSQEDFQQQVLRSFEGIDKRFQAIDNRFQEIDNRFQEFDKKFDKLDFDIKEANIRIDAYQKSSVQVVNLAFGLISAAAAVVILSPAVKALTEFFLSR